jgi:hypothetical protein
MANARAESAYNWCIVADASGPQWRVSGEPDTSRAPIQFRGLAEPTTMRQKALHRACRISGHTSIPGTAADPHRAYRHRSLWFIPAERIFVADHHTAASLLRGIARERDGKLLRHEASREYTVPTLLHEISRRHGWMVSRSTNQATLVS